MLPEKAKRLYLGRDGGKRMNCAQAIATTFKETHRLDDQWIRSLDAYGSGKAPGGLCGAYYAAACILEKTGNDKTEQLESFFLEHAGSLKCEEIKGTRSLPCVGCVENTAIFLEREFSV